MRIGIVFLILKHTIMKDREQSLSEKAAREYADSLILNQPSWSIDRIETAREDAYNDFLAGASWGLSVEFSVPHIDCPHCGSDSYKKNDGIESCENYLCDLNSPSNEQK